MQGAKPWQIGLIVLAVIAVIASISYNIFFSDRIPDRPASLTLIDISTGELIVSPFPPGQAALLPAVNPTTNETTLFPVEKVGDGWQIADRYLSLARNVANKSKSKILQGSKNGAVTPSNSEPKPVNVFPAN